MKFYKFDAISVPNNKSKKPKFTTTPNKVVEDTAVKKPRAKKIEQAD